MNKIIFIALAAAATTAFAGAVRRPRPNMATGGNVPIRSDQLQMQLQAGVRSGAISRAEAMPLREQLMQLTRLERLYARDGISGRERADLQHRINTLRQGIRMAERSGDGRYGRDDDRFDSATTVTAAARDGRYDRNNDGWDDRDGNRDGRWDVDARNDSNRDGYDDRDHDRDGRWDNDEGYGREQVADRGVVGQIIDRVTGTGGLRVGQRASADLGAVPYAYRNAISRRRRRLLPLRRTPDLPDRRPHPDGGAHLRDEQVSELRRPD